jgi:hypothetical protein
MGLVIASTQFAVNRSASIGPECAKNGAVAARPGRSARDQKAVTPVLVTLSLTTQAPQRGGEGKAGGRRRRCLLHCVGC